MPEPVVSGGKPDPRDFALQICFSEHCRWSTRHILSNENRFRCCKSVGKRWCDGAGGLLTLGFRSPMLARMLAGMAMGPIFDCRETATGPCPWRRTACESVGKRWCDVAGGLLTLGFRSHRCLHACWRGMVMGPIFDCRETVMGPCPWRRTACESGEKRWCDGLLTLGFRPHRCLHECLRGSDVTRFSTVERPRWGRATLISKR